MAEPAYELRILTGVHAGARAPITEPLTIGTDAECDIVLSDAGVAAQHANITLKSGKWFVVPLQPVEGIPGEGIQLAPGARIALGTTLVSVDAANAPWEDGADYPASTFAGTSDTEINDRPLSEELSSETALIAETPTSNLSEQPSRARVLMQRIWLRSQRFMMIMVLSGVLGSMGLAISIGLFHLLFEAREAVPVITPLYERTDYRMIRSLLQQQHLNQRLAITMPAESNHLLVSGWVLNQSEYENLAEVLAKISPRPALRVYNEQEVLSGARAVLDQTSKAITIDHLGGGRFRLSGVLMSTEQRENIIQSLHEELPSVSSLEDQTVLVPELITQTSTELNDAGLTNIKVAWLNKQLELQGAIEHQDVERFEKFLLAFNQRYQGKVPLHAQLFGATTPLGNLSELPFKIRGVVGGNTPYIVLADGSKIFVGGVVRDYQLTNINATDVVFEGPNRIVFKR